MEELASSALTVDSEELDLRTLWWWVAVGQEEGRDSAPFQVLLEKECSF